MIIINKLFFTIIKPIHSINDIFYKIWINLSFLALSAYKINNLYQSSITLKKLLDYN